jgi:hypothetical protein
MSVAFGPLQPSARFDSGAPHRLKPSCRPAAPCCTAAATPLTLIQAVLGGEVTLVLTIADRTQHFLDEFGAALAANDADRATGMWSADCFWRDLSAFACSLKPGEGLCQVWEMLKSQLSHAAPSNVRRRTAAAPPRGSRLKPPKAVAGG